MRRSAVRASVHSSVQGSEPVSAVQFIRDNRVRLRRPARWVAVLGAAVLLAGCGTVPGAAAEVDGTRISEQSVQDRTQTLIDEQAPDPSAVDALTRAGLNRYQVTDAVRHQLVLAAAKAQGITVTKAQVNSYITQAGGAKKVGEGLLPVPIDRVPDAIYDYLVLEQMVKRLPKAGVDVTDVQITADIVQAADRDAAVADRVRYLKDPAAMAADAKASNSAGVPLSLLARPDLASLGILTAPEGQIVVLAQPGAPGYLVVRVTSRTDKPTKLTAQTMQSVSSVGDYLSLASLLLGKDAKDVTVNPRFGQWDPTALVVVPANNGT